MARRRRIGLLVLAIAGWTPSAHAQAAGFALNRFEPAERGSTFFASESLDLRGRARPSAGLVLDYQYRPLAIVGPDDLFPNVTGEGAAKRAVELGFQVVYQGKYPKNANDLSSVATQLKAAAPDIVLSTGYAQDTILLMKSMQELRVKPKMVGVAMSIGTAFGRIAGTRGAAAAGYEHPEKENRHDCATA